MNLLDAKKSLNVNIFLRQFRMSHCQLVNHLRTVTLGGRHSTHCNNTGASRDQIDSEQQHSPADGLELGVERLRGLYKVLPETEEIETLKTFSAGDTSQLGSAEKFYLELIQLSE